MSLSFPHWFHEGSSRVEIQQVHRFDHLTWCYVTINPMQEKGIFIIPRIN